MNVMSVCFKFKITPNLINEKGLIKDGNVYFNEFITSDQNSKLQLLVKLLKCCSPQ